MNAVIFCDLDGTLIHSHRVNLENGVLVEMYNDKPLSYMNYKAYEKLQSISKEQLIPVTSRTIEQYNRISLYRDGGFPKYALLDNGGTLIVDGKEDLCWKSDIQEYISDELLKYDELITRVKEYGETKLQDDLVIFVKPFSEKHKFLLERYIRKCMGMQVFQHGSKVYICSDKLTKGHAIEQFVKKYSIGSAIAAGDSSVDITMIEHVYHGFFPPELKENIEDKYLSKISFVDKFDLAEHILNFEM